MKLHCPAARGCEVGRWSLSRADDVITNMAALGSARCLLRNCCRVKHVERSRQMVARAAVRTLCGGAPENGKLCRGAGYYWGFITASLHHWPCSVFLTTSACQTQQTREFKVPHRSRTWLCRVISNCWLKKFIQHLSKFCCTDWSRFISINLKEESRVSIQSYVFKNCRGAYIYNW